MRKHFV